MVDENARKADISIRTSQEASMTFSSPCTHYCELFKVLCGLEIIQKLFKIYNLYVDDKLFKKISAHPYIFRWSWTDSRILNHQKSILKIYNKGIQNPYW